MERVPSEQNAGAFKNIDGMPHQPLQVHDVACPGHIVRPLSILQARGDLSP